MAKLLNKNYMGEGVNQTEPLDNFRESSYNDGSTWKKSNRYALKYAGDGALQSVSRGLQDAKDFMRDADGGVNFSDVQTSAVKWRLASDAHNSALEESARNEMIGTLSSENKAAYLKDTRPLSDYVNAKDTYDQSRGGYTTTGNLTAQPGAKIRTMQRQLNRAGYTDKFGEPLKEEGVLGAKTLFAAEQAHMSDGSAGPYKQTTAYVPPSNVKAEFKADTGTFDYDTRLSYSQTYSTNVAVLQNELAWLGYLDMSDGGWGYFGPKTQAAVNAYKNDNGLGNTGKDAGVIGKDTWSSLGLIYRTQADIDAGVKILNRDRKQYFDITEPLTNKLDEISKEAARHGGQDDSLLWFISQVAGGNPWDIKLEKRWRDTLGITYPGSTTSPVVVHNKFVTPEELGNITYGYIGAALGLSMPILYAGSFAAAIMDNGGKIGNEAEDRISIKKGYEWYHGKWIW